MVTLQLGCAGQDPRVFLFPFFSVGVNLFFISLLDKYESDIILNPLFQCAPNADLMRTAACTSCQCMIPGFTALCKTECMALVGMRAAHVMSFEVLTQSLLQCL